jgi:hypothetical protein
LTPEVLYLFLYAFILFVVNRNAMFDVFILLLKQVCMCEQWLALDLMSSVITHFVFCEVFCCIKVKEPL